MCQPAFLTLSETLLVKYFSLYVSPGNEFSSSDAKLRQKFKLKPFLESNYWHTELRLSRPLPSASFSLFRPPTPTIFSLLAGHLLASFWQKKKFKYVFLLHTSLVSKLRIAFVWASSIPFVACVQQRKQKTFAGRWLSWPTTIKIDDVTRGTRSVVRHGQSRYFRCNFVNLIWIFFNFVVSP